MPRKSMRSRRSRRGGDWMSPSTWFGSKKPDDTGYGSTGSMGSTGYGSTGTTGYGSTGTTGYGSTGTTGYGSTGTTGYGSTTGYGGKKGKRRRSMRGGDYSDNISLTNLASNAAPVSGTPTASALYVGGRTRRRRHHRHNKSCKKSCRKH